MSAAPKTADALASATVTTTDVVVIFDRLGGADGPVKARLARLREWAAANGLSVVGEFVENRDDTARLAPQLVAAVIAAQERHTGVLMSDGDLALTDQDALRWMIGVLSLAGLKLYTPDVCDLAGDSPSVDASLLAARPSRTERRDVQAAGE